ncbi:MAG: hypothetical protein R3F38_14095 [Gammaproteobacteria bacterium]
MRRLLILMKLNFTSFLSQRRRWPFEISFPDGVLCFPAQTHQFGTADAVQALTAGPAFKLGLPATTFVSVVPTACAVLLAIE